MNDTPYLEKAALQLGMIFGALFSYLVTPWVLAVFAFLFMVYYAVQASRKGEL